MRIAFAILLCMLSGMAYAQTEENLLQDSLYIQEVEYIKQPEKVLHTEPLFIDLIRDLGAQKGEHEWNFGVGITDNLKYDTYQALVEYEFAPVDRLGLEVEVPFTFHAPLNGTPGAEVPAHRAESLKTAIQWSFFVSQKISTSMALGYINEIEFHDFDRMSRQSIIKANLFNPFFVVAKRWGNNFHTLVYTGPRLGKTYGDPHWHKQYDINSSFHYMIPGTRNFVGVEFNKELQNHDFNMVVRPQLRLGITDNLLLGIVAGVPISRQDQRFSSFVRLIWEPGVRHTH
ncbi:MAG: phosphoribosylformylglycinamidine synthase [Sphingobacteriales bacterium]|nr:MAG: phosphoribosylformylglycinamidine synthase [Sphingobacteriales bacterium]